MKRHINSRENVVLFPRTARVLSSDLGGFWPIRRPQNLFDRHSGRLQEQKQTQWQDSDYRRG